MAGNVSTAGASVASRVLALLSAFDADHRHLTLTEMARRADLPVPTAHRLAGELVRGGMLVRRPTGKYVISRRVWDLGLLAPLQSGLREIASPFLGDLHATTLATVHLAVRDRTQALYVERLSGLTSVPVVSTVGSRLPLHATGVGKVLLAHAPDRVQKQVLGNLARITPYTITQPGRMKEQMARIRHAGYAVTKEEMSLGACSVAVPVHSGTPRAEVVGSIGVVVPSLKRDRTRLVAALRVAAQGIGRSLETSS